MRQRQQPWSRTAVWHSTGTASAWQRCTSRWGVAGRGCAGRCRALVKGCESELYVGLPCLLTLAYARSGMAYRSQTFLLQLLLAHACVVRMQGSRARNVPAYHCTSEGRSTVCLTVACVDTWSEGSRGPDKPRRLSNSPPAVCLCCVFVCIVCFCCVHVFSYAGGLHPPELRQGP